MMENELHTIANELFSWTIQIITAYFFYRFCRIFIINKSVWMAALVYVVTVFSLESIFEDISNFGVYLIASVTALLILLPIKNASIPLKLFIVITYFSIRWMAPTVIITLYTPINKVAFNLLESWVIPKIANLEMGYFTYIVCMMIVLIILYFAALWLVIYLYQKYVNLNRRIFTTRELFILMLPALSGMSSYAMMNKYHKTFQDEQADMILQQFHGNWALHNIITLLAMFAVLILMQKLDQTRRQEQQALLLMNQSNQLQQHLASIDSLYQEMKFMKHDIQNHLTVIERLIEKENYHEAGTYLKYISNEANEVIPTTKSGNAIIDTLIQEKYKQALKVNTLLTSKLVFPQLAEIDVYDLSIVLHNALDNSIRATKHINGATIDLASIQHKTSYVITIKNPFKGPLSWQDGQLKSTKSDSFNEGLGLQIIHDIAKKYHGNVDIDTSENVFECTILFLLKKSTDTNQSLQN